MGTNDNEDNDDESEMLTALSMITPNVKYSKKKAMSMAQISSIARKVKSGAIKLPDLDLGNNSEYECVWALVDSVGMSLLRRLRSPLPMVRISPTLER